MSGSVTLPQTGGSGGGGIVSINGSTAPAQSIVGGAGINVSSSLGTTTVAASVIPIANGGTGQSNAQAGLNNLTDIGAHTNGDVMQLLGGNAQFAPFTVTPPTLAEISAAIAAPANSFIFSDAGQQIAGYGNWHIDPTTFFSSIDNFLYPNNLGLFAPAYSWNVNVAPLQNSPDDSLRLQSFTVGLDTSAAGFSFGSNGQAAELIGGGYNYGGNGASIGNLRNINFFTGLGNGTDPGTFKTLAGSSHAYTVSANITLDGGVSGYDFNMNVNAAAITTSNFSIIWMSDFSQLPVDVYGYQGSVCQPNVATIKNNHNLNAYSASPTVTLFEGNSGFSGYSVGGTVTTLGTGGYSAFGASTNITTLPATASLNGFSLFNQITTAAATSTIRGAGMSPAITTLHGNFTGFESFPQVAGGDGNVQLFTGSVGGVTTTGNSSVLSLNGLTANGQQSSFSADGIRTNLGGRLDAADNQGVQGQHVIFTEYHTPASTTIVGTDIIVNILSPDVDWGDATSNLTLGPSGLGFNFVGFAGQMHGHGSVDLASAVLPTAIFADDFTMTEWRNVNAYVINAGYTGVCTKATAFYHEVAGAGLFATTHWGLRVVSDVENSITKLVVNATSQVVSNASCGIELSGTDRAIRFSNLTTTERLALTPLAGMQVFDTTLLQMAYYNGTVWTVF